MADAPLAWVCDAIEIDRWQANSCFGVYEVWASSGTCWVHAPGLHRATPGSPDIPAAKAIAQAHYEEAHRVAAHHDATGDATFKSR